MPLPNTLSPDAVLAVAGVGVVAVTAFTVK